MGASPLLCVTIPPPKGKTPLSIGTQAQELSSTLSLNLVFEIPRIAHLPGRFACLDLANTWAGEPARLVTGAVMLPEGYRCGVSAFNDGAVRSGLVFG